MCEQAVCTGWNRQRYKDGYRLVAGCIPFKYEGEDEMCGGKPKKTVKVLMIDTKRGHGLVFPKGGWENDEAIEEAAVREATEEAGVRGDLEVSLGHYNFRSKRHRDVSCPDGLCRAAMFALHVKEELHLWPEQSTRTRKWLSVAKATKKCRHPWMREALAKFSDYQNGAGADNDGTTAADGAEGHLQPSTESNDR